MSCSEYRPKISLCSLSCHAHNKSVTMNSFHSTEPLIELSRRIGDGAVSIYQIEVRAISEQYYVLARLVAREILQLPTRQLPSLAAICASAAPLSIRSSQLYYLIGDLTPSQIDQLTQQLLIDPVVQEAEVSQKPKAAIAGHIVDVSFHAGVTDTLAESVQAGASMLGITGLERVETGKRYVLDQRLSMDKVHNITNALLYNPVIQHYVLQNGNGGTRSSVSSSLDANEHTGTTNHAQEDPANRIPTYIRLTDLTGEQLLELSRTGLLALNLDEMCAIQAHFREQGREPTDVELETLAQTWSEHCSHKTLKGKIDFDGRRIDNLLKETIFGATQEIRRRLGKDDWCVSVFEDNAGVVKFNDRYHVCFKVETHNHPSAIEPYGGANTGLGGVIRDPLGTGLGAKPVCNTDVFCFAPPGI